MAHDNWKYDLKWSSEAFLRLIAPVLIERWGGVFTPIEGEDEEIKRQFDIDGGIDFIHRQENGGMRSVASRIQVTGRYRDDFKTFTIRHSRDTGTRTEWAKRIEAIENGLVYPTFTVHGYVSNTTPNSTLLSFAICKTDVLISRLQSKLRQVDAGQLREDKVLRRTSNAQFLYEPWGDWCDMVYQTYDASKKVYRNMDVSSAMRYRKETGLCPVCRVRPANRVACDSAECQSLWLIGRIPPYYQERT